MVTRIATLFLLTFAALYPSAATALDFSYSLSWTCNYQDKDGAKFIRGTLPLTRCDSPALRYQIGSSCSGSFDKTIDGVNLYVAGSLTPVGSSSFEVSNFMTAIYRAADPTSDSIPDLLGSMISGVQVRLGQRFNSAAIYYHHEGDTVAMTYGQCAFTFVTIVPLPKLRQ
jgi:hypothetical protein